jgi:hypothetical protein
MQNELGPCAQFSVYHLMQLKEGEERLKLNDGSPGMFSQELTMICASESSNIISSPSPLRVSGKGVKSKETANNVAENKQKPRTNPKTLGDISKLLRSKNAGPYEITLDVMFDSEAEYQILKKSDLLSTTSMAKLFEINESEVLWSGFFDQALAYKVTIPRMRNGKPTASGGYMENDVHASQQYIGLMNLALPQYLLEEWNKLQQRKDGASPGM